PSRARCTTPLHEITARHYRDIAERDARYRNLLEQAREGVVAESEGRVVFANPPAMELLGGTREEDGAGRIFLDLAAPEDRETLSGIFTAPTAAALPERHVIAG